MQATQFGIAGQSGLAWVAGLGAAGFAAFVFQGFRRVRPPIRILSSRWMPWRDTC